MTTALLFARPLRPGGVLAIDVSFAVGVTVLCVYAASEAPVDGAHGVREPLWLSAAVGLLLGLPLAIRRRRPIVVWGIVFATSFAALVTGVIPEYAGAAPSIALAFALYMVGMAVPHRQSVAILAICLTGFGAALVVVLLGTDWSSGVSVATSAGEVGFACLMMTAAWLVGWVIRERQAYAAQAAEQLADRAVRDERLRIARELHDIVAHSMSLIAVKAAIGNHVADARPAEARDALRIIESTSRTALQDIRRALGVLREDASYAPAPGLDGLPALAEQAAAGGVEVDLVVSGSAEPPSGVALAVFRIVQESLTNVVKHAAPARCRVVVELSPGEVRIVVTDDGKSALAGGPVELGHGLIGIRERVAMYGGEFSAVPAPAPVGGFRVSVRLPYEPVVA